MANTSQKRALSAYRKRLSQRGMARFEVLGLSTDRELIRSVARRLADKGPEATQIRAALRDSIADETAKKGKVLDALRRSPLVGADLKAARSVADDRKVRL
jgi:hypothetical protein